MSRPAGKRNVLVTGGSNGIGREAVQSFARGGDTVWFTYASGADRAREMVGQFTAEGLDVQAFAFSQGGWESHERLLAALPGPVDVLINNAAVGSKTVERYAPASAAERSAAMLRINSLGPLWLTQRLVPGMVERGYGKVVNVASVGGGIASFPGFDLADGMSKAALVHLSRQLAVELAHTSVDVFAVCPGAVETDMLNASVLGRMDATTRRSFVTRLPKGRLIRPVEIAELIRWLCTDDAAVLHGAVLDASLGLGLVPGMFQPDVPGPHPEPAGAGQPEALAAAGEGPNHCRAGADVLMVSRQAARLIGDTPAIAAAHFAAEADPYAPGHNPGGYVNLGTAENRLVWDLLAPRLHAARPVGPADTRYAPLYGTPGLRAAVARFLTRTRGVPVDPEDVLVVSGATAALDIIASVLCDPGEAIAVPVPYYGALDTDLAGRSQAMLLPVSTAPGDGVLPGAAAVAEAVTRARAAGVTVRTLALTSPHNPLGVVYDAATLDRYARACAHLDLHLIADEIYANSVFTATPFTSALNLAPDALAPDRVHVIWGFAKDFGLPGWKVGILHTRGTEVRAAARELAYFAPVSTDTQWWLEDLLTDDAWVATFLRTSRQRLADSYAAATDRLHAAGLAFAPAEAGFSIWTDLRPWLAEESFAAERALWSRLFTDGRVSILPGEVFHSPVPGWFRLCHTADPQAVGEGIDRLRRVIEGVRPVGELTGEVRPITRQSRYKQPQSPLYQA